MALLALAITLPAKAQAAQAAFTADWPGQPAAGGEMASHPGMVSTAPAAERLRQDTAATGFRNHSAPIPLHANWTADRMTPVAATSPSELPSQPGDTLTCYYYGERVVPRLPNPCKGRTLRKLACVVYPGTWTQPAADGLRHPVVIMHIPADTSDELYDRFLKLERRTAGLTVVRDFTPGPAAVVQR